VPRITAIAVFHALSHPVAIDTFVALRWSKWTHRSTTNIALQPPARIIHKLSTNFFRYARPLVRLSTERREEGAMQLIALSVLVAQSLFGGLPIDGIRCEQMEGAVEHIHSNVQIFDRGRSIAVPAEVGFSQSGSCLYWVHTHADNGMIHIESPVKRTFTLGNFFDIWGQPLSWSTAAGAHGKRLSIWVNGKPWSGKDPRSIVLQDHETIVIQNGPPFAKPKPADFSKV
jgi:hypothetical protein